MIGRRVRYPANTILRGSPEVVSLDLGALPTLKTQLAFRWRKILGCVVLAPRTKMSTRPCSNRPAARPISPRPIRMRSLSVLGRGIFSNHTNKFSRLCSGRVMNSGSPKYE